MKDAYIVVPGFLKHAEEMRACYDRHFDSPHRNAPLSHQIWDYWHVPDLYTYLRTSPRRVFPSAVVDLFVEELRAWATDQLGMSAISEPTLSLYVDGCGQGLHNDSENGRWGYVFSLTRWDERRFSGGETLLFKDIGYWSSGRFRYAGGGTCFYDLVPARFNQLLVFDDRVIHAVRPVQGAMDPRQGRIVIHGHIHEAGISVAGSLAQQDVEPAVSDAIGAIRARLGGGVGIYHGCVSVRIAVQSDGGVGGVTVLNDRVFRTRPDAPEPAWLVDEIGNCLRGLRFQQAPGPSVVTIPIPFG